MSRTITIMLSKVHFRWLRRPKRSPQQVWDDRVLHDADALAVISWGVREGAVTDSRDLAAEWRKAAKRMEPEPGPAVSAASLRTAWGAAEESPEMPGPGHDAQTRRIEPEVCHCGHSQRTCTL